MKTGTATFRLSINSTAERDAIETAFNACKALSERAAAFATTDSITTSALLFKHKALQATQEYTDCMQAAGSHSLQRAIQNGLAQAYYPHRIKPPHIRMRATYHKVKGHPPIINIHDDGTITTKPINRLPSFRILDWDMPPDTVNLSWTITEDTQTPGVFWITFSRRATTEQEAAVINTNTTDETRQTRRKQIVQHLLNAKHQLAARQ